MIVEDEAACKLFDCLVAYNKMATKVMPENSKLKDQITIGVWPTSELPAVKAAAPNRF